MFGDATTLATQSQTTTTGGGAWNTLNKILGIGTQAASIVSQIKNSGASQSPTLPTSINVNTPTPAAENNTTKYVLIGLGVLGAGGLIYAISKKAKKK